MELRSGYVTGQGILSPQMRPVFEQGVSILFERWTALGLAVENEWGGADSKQKAQALYQEVLEWFYRKKGKPNGLVVLRGARPWHTPGRLPGARCRTAVVPPPNHPAGTHLPAGRCSCGWCCR